MPPGRAGPGVAPFCHNPRSCEGRGRRLYPAGVRAVVITAPGGPGVLRVVDRPEPRPARGEVLVEVRAAALNRADLLQRRGLHPAPPDAPADVPGLEFAGRIAEVGEGVRGVAVGRRVMGIAAGGAQAERLAIDAGLCLDVPEGLGWVEAAALPEAAITAWDALLLQGELAGGERVLVQAAGSGVGTAALQVATAAGATAVGLTRSADKRRRLAELGPWPVLDAAAENLAARIREAAGGPIDLSLDCIGPASWPLHAAVLAERGRIVVIGLLGGAVAAVDFAPLLTRRLTLRGTLLRSRPLHEKIALVREAERTLLPWIACGRVRATVDSVLPLEAVAAAHERMEQNANLGKIVLTVGAGA